MSQDSPARRTVLERTRPARWALAVLIVVAAFAAAATGVLQVCGDELAGSSTRSVCRAPEAGDGVTLGLGLVVLLLLLPDTSEIGLAGIVQIRSRLAQQEEATERLASRVSAVSAAVQSQLSTASAVSSGAVVNVVSGVATGRYAAGQAAPEGDAAAHGRDQARYVTAELLVSHLGDIGTGVLSEANLRLYLPTEDGSRLRPVLDEPGARLHADEWPVGSGAVGRAWAGGEIVVLRGDEVVDDLGPGLAERRARYASLAVIVALPVFDAARRPIAVLSASSRDPASDLDQPDSLSDLLAASEVVARILVDLLGWARDDPTLDPDGGERHHG
jgi:hypothetical protein